jgi:hypothetical protein
MTNHTSFSIIPEHNELSAIDRELRFHQSTTERPKALTREQIDVFNR